jgi:hypothetical protein
MNGGFAAGVAAEEMVAIRVWGFAAWADLIGGNKGEAEFALKSKGKDVRREVVVAMFARKTVEREAGGVVEEAGESKLDIRRKRGGVGVESMAGEGAVKGTVEARSRCLLEEFKRRRGITRMEKRK